ncbi:hypothetical protein F4778DRAFT_746990 [Xylariomycetidae sp. FL2044]|nr:hypothetical protein F4778DRAFT_746990 [Xylariomycetidae sp. FL2044]
MADVTLTTGIAGSFHVSVQLVDMHQYPFVNGKVCKGCSDKGRSATCPMTLCPKPSPLTQVKAITDLKPQKVSFGARSWSEKLRKRSYKKAYIYISSSSSQTSQFSLPPNSPSYTPIQIPTYTQETTQSSHTSSTSTNTTAPFTLETIIIMHFSFTTLTSLAAILAGLSTSVYAVPQCCDNTCTQCTFVSCDEVHCEDVPAWSWCCDVKKIEGTEDYVNQEGSLVNMVDVKL